MLHMYIPKSEPGFEASMESTLNTQNSNSINLLSILNSLTPSQLESLLDSATKDILKTLEMKAAVMVLNMLFYLCHNRL